MLKYLVTAAAIAGFGTVAAANNGIGQAVSQAFKGGPNSIHGSSYGAVNSGINAEIRENGSYESVHGGTYDKPGVGNRIGNGVGTRDSGVESNRDGNRD